VTPLQIGGTRPLVPTLTVSGPWEAVLEGTAAAGVEGMLLGYLRRRRWFGGRGNVSCP
jgi:hypothetical protein